MSAGTTAGESLSPLVPFAGCRPGSPAGPVPVAARMIALYALLGFAAGIAHFASQGGNARLWVEGSRWQALSLQAVRLAVAVSLVVVVGHAGFWPLLLAATGFLLSAAAARLWRRTQAQAE